MTVTANFETGPDPAIAEMYNGNFRQGDVGDTYTITVTNLGQAATSGALQWVDTLPAASDGDWALRSIGLDLHGWNVDLLDFERAGGRRERGVYAYSERGGKRSAFCHQHSDRCGWRRRAPQ